MRISIKRIINEMPKDLTDIEKLRYAYLKCAEILAYDRDFLYEQNQSEESNKKYNKEISTFNIENENNGKKIKVTCKQMTGLYIQTINTIFGRLVAKEIGYREGKINHVATLVRINGKYYFMDLFEDIYRIQKGMTTKYFAPERKDLKSQIKFYYQFKRELRDIKCKTIKYKELKKIDDKLGYTNNGLYMDDAIAMLRDEMRDKKTWEKYVNNYNTLNKNEQKDAIFKWKVDFMFRFIKNNLQEENKLEIFEVERFFRKLYYSILTREERKNNKMATIHIHNNDKTTVLYRIENNGGNLYYLYNHDIKGFEQMDFDTLEEMRKNGELSYDSSIQNNPNDGYAR